jgi:predicted methyltransferase
LRAVDEGNYRVLCALATRTRIPWDEVPRRSGEASSVVKELTRDKPAWIDGTAEGLRLSERGLAALALEMVARDRGAPAAHEDAALVAQLTAFARERGPAKRELDQVYATAESSLRRARRLIAAGEVQRGLVLLGDDDLTSLAIHLLEPEKRVTVLDVDPELLALLDRVASEHGFPLRAIQHDLRDPIPKALAGKHGAAFTDPPYAPLGFRLFVSRAIDLLRPDGRLYVAFGYSRRASERGLEKQKTLLEAGLCIEEALPHFAEYEGAEAIGSRSTLFVCARTPKSKPLVRGREEGDLYTSREPKGSR